MLGGMDDLCQFAYETCKRCISVDSIGVWLEFVDAIPSSSSSGAATPDVSPIRVFGNYAKRLRDDVFHFLVVGLPQMLELRAAFSDGTPTSPDNGRQILLQVFARVPFEMFKAVVESPNFQIGMWKNTLIFPRYN